MGAQNVSRNAYGWYGVDPPPAGIPDHELRAWPDNAASNKHRPTPKQDDSTCEDSRVRGERVYDAVTLPALWGIVDTPRLTPPMDRITTKLVSPKRRFPSKNEATISRGWLAISPRHPRTTRGYHTPEWRDVFTGEAAR